MTLLDVAETGRPASSLVGLGEARSRLEVLRASLWTPPELESTQTPRRLAVVGLAGVGGSGKVAAETAEGLARIGHQVWYVTGPEPAFAPAGVTPVPASVPREPRAAEAGWVGSLSAELAALLSRERIDVLFVHYVAGTLEAALRARERARVSTRIVAVLHGSDITRWGEAAGQAERLRDALDSADEVVSVSPWLAGRARTLLGLRREPVIVDNSVDTERFRPSNWSAQVRARFAPSNALLLGHVSNMRPVKRAADAVDTLVALSRLGVDARLLLVGDGPERAQIQARAASTAAGDRTILTGAVPPSELPELVAACDLMLVTSASESFSLVALEAMASGVPVVSTRCGGLERIMNRLATVGGIAPVEVGAPSQLAEGARRLWSSAERYRAVQVAGLRMALEDFPRRRQLEGYARLAQELSPSE